MNKQTTSTRMLVPIAMIALGIVLLIVVSIAMWSINNNTKLTHEYLHKEGHLIAEGLVNAIADDLIHKDYAALEKRLLQSASSQNICSILVISAQGQVLGHVVGCKKDSAAHPDFSIKHVNPPKSIGHISEQMHSGYLNIWHKVELGTTIGWVQVEISIGKYTSAIEQMQHRTWLLAVIVAILGVFLLGGAILHSYKILHSHERKERNTRRHLENKAYYDSLTHLPNRSLLYDRLHQCVARSNRNDKLLAVCFVDLNNFKPVNDNYGHKVGDRVLIEVAQRLLSAVREEDTVSRQGGDEFIVLLGSLSSENEAENAVNRLAESLNRPMQLEGKTIDIEGSIGYVLYPNDSDDEQSLVELADKSMYTAKSKAQKFIYRYKEYKET